MRNLGQKFRLLAVIAAFAALLPIMGFEASQAPDKSNRTPSHSDAEIPEFDSTRDGPHVFWQNDSTAIVLYLCRESIEKQVHAVRDTLRFFGLCHDSNTEYVLTPASKFIKPTVYNSVSRIMALSDIHGEYEFMTGILKNSGVVDDNLHWNWGNGHLVIVGDVFDRGDMVTECLWLIYRLELEADKYGGKVHFVLGNHELMVLRGDNRYINDKYMNGIAKKSRILHQDLYGPDMELGKWLRSKHAAVKINEILFVHGGISSFLIDEGYGLEKLNNVVCYNIDIRSSQLAFNDEIRFLFGSKGPFWYRGYHYEMENRYPMATHDEIEDILEFFNAEAVVVGHTEVDRITSLHEGTVLAIDVPAEDIGGFQALLWKDGEFYIVTAEGESIPIK